MHVFDFVFKAVALLNASITLSGKLHNVLKKCMKKGPSDAATSDRPVDDCQSNR